MMQDVYSLLITAQDEKKFQKALALANKDDSLGEESCSFEDDVFELPPFKNGP